MGDTAEITAAASVVDFGIAEFAARPVADQLTLKERLETALAGVLARMPRDERIVLDTGEGLSVVFLGSPAHALRAALATRERAHAGVPLCIGLNFGPVRLTEDGGGRPNVLGDGVNAAQTLAAFAQPDQVLASRTFFDAVSRAAPALGELFRHQGERTDRNVRAHDLYAVDTGSTAAAAPVQPGRRRLLSALAIAVPLILASGVGVRVARERIALSRKPAVVLLAITPAAEVVIDGKARGRTPPLRSVELAPGRHTVEIRHPGHSPITVEVDLKPGEETTVRHAFGSPPAEASKFRNLMRKFGL